LGQPLMSMQLSIVTGGYNSEGIANSINEPSLI